MEDILVITLTIVGVIAFFYYGYRHDYRREPKTFWKNIIGIPVLGVCAFTGLESINIFITKWINRNEK